MGTALRRTDAPLIGELLDRPYEFDFFQALRLLERARREDGAPRGADGDGPAGIRFRAAASLAFPSAAIQEIRVASATDGWAAAADAVEVTVSFIGLTGPAGVLPQHYTSLLIDQARARDFALRDFLDLFNHRIVSLFFRAWEKYRFPAAYERAAASGEDGEGAGAYASPPADAWPDGADDPFTACLFSLVGMGAPSLRGRSAVHDEALVYYGGHFARGVRSAVALEMLLADYLGLGVRVEQHRGQWLKLGRDQQTRMTATGFCLGGAQPGDGAAIGDRAWDAQGRFRIRIGPLSYAEFLGFLPGGCAWAQVIELTRAFVGLDFDFDVQPVLRAADVPPWRLGAGGMGDGNDGQRLGRNAWVRFSSFARDFDGAVFDSADACGTTDGKRDTL